MTVSESTQADLKGNILLIGDLLIDRTFYVDVSKLSPEAPVPVAMLTGNPIDTPGGAGLAAAFSAVDRIPIIFATYTSIETASWMSNIYNIPIIHPCIHSENTNAIKTRYIDNERHYHLLRVDNDKTVLHPFQSKEDEEEWFRQIEQSIKSDNIKVIALLDYRKGLFNKSRSQRLITMAQRANLSIYVDSRCSNLTKFTGANIIKLNSEEYKTACEKYNTDKPDELASQIGIDFIIETQGANGAQMWDGRYTNHRGSRGYACHKPDLAEHEGSPDVTGCGDVFDVTFCYQWGIKKVGFHSAIRIAVETATEYAYQPIGERLNAGTNI